MAKFKRFDPRNKKAHSNKEYTHRSSEKKNQNYDKLQHKDEFKTFDKYKRIDLDESEEV